MTLLHVPTVRLMTRVRRFGAAVLLLLSLLAGSPERAHASVGQAYAADAIPIAGAVFSPRRAQEGLAWDARYIVEAGVAFDSTSGTVLFASPLPSGETMLPAAGISPLLEGDRIRGVRVDRTAILDRSIAITFLQREAVRPDAAFPLGAPVVDGNAVQIVRTAIADTPDTRLQLLGNDALEKHVGYVAARTISDGAREEARRLTEVASDGRGSVAYLRAEDVRIADGLRVRVVDAASTRSRNATGILVLFGGVLAALVLAARKLRDAAVTERADALLASEIEDAARAAGPR